MLMSLICCRSFCFIVIDFYKGKGIKITSKKKDLISQILININVKTMFPNEDHLLTHRCVNLHDLRINKDAHIYIDGVNTKTIFFTIHDELSKVIFSFCKTIELNVPYNIGLLLIGEYKCQNTLVIIFYHTSQLNKFSWSSFSLGSPLLVLVDRRQPIHL